ncbi:copper homeostasis protein CutC [Pedobacter deserti]|uniref:copper homeostasis protein CutC n=1 Tax=Pedobacter deserti TaxID=2817382 RepID=UPI00210D38CE|nr:copper homeostasis protein CutC [Pedobacter sp. SYSU D00382]
MINMEVCANSLRSALEAQQGGAVRVELCDNLPEGGTTPSYAQIKLARQLLNIQVYPIIRPRGGDFLYTDLEFEIMKEDILQCKALGCDGVVIGILHTDGTVDKARCAELIGLAGSMGVTFHRAFDMTRDLFEAMDDIIELGCERILTSGGKASAVEGADTISELVRLSAGRISIMPGAGVNTTNIAGLIQRTGALEFHASARRLQPGGMLFRNEGLCMGAETDEFSYHLTDSQLVSELIRLARGTQ